MQRAHPERRTWLKALQSGILTMTDLLQQAFDRASELPQDEQNAFARFLLAELDAERRWDELLDRPESQDVLERMADEAISAHRTGRTEPLNLSHR